MPPLNHIPDLAFEIDGDLIRLEQSDSGNIDTIVLHRLHLRHLAEECGLLAPAPLPAVPHHDLAAGPLTMKHIGIGLDDDGTIILYQTRTHGMGGTDDEIHLHPLQAAWLAAQLVALVGTPEELRNEKSSPPRNEKSDAAITVTSPEPKRGRPVTGQALTAAERQARHRARQADLLDTTAAGTEPCGQGNS